MAVKSSVTIRRADREDLETVVSWMEDPDFQRFLYGDSTQSAKQIRQRIVGMLGRNSTHMAPQTVHFIAESKKYGPVGLFSVVNISWRNRSCNIDSYLAPERRNGVYGLVGFRRVLDYCFQVLNMTRINIYIYGFNSRSWRMFEITGAKRELELPQHVVRDGERYEMFGYGLLREDYRRVQEMFEKRFRGIDLMTMIDTLKERPDTQEQPR